MRQKSALCIQLNASGGIGKCHSIPNAKSNFDSAPLSLFHCVNGNYHTVLLRPLLKTRLFAVGLISIRRGSLNLSRRVKDSRMACQSRSARLTSTEVTERRVYAPRNQTLLSVSHSFYESAASKGAPGMVPQQNDNAFNRLDLANRLKNWASMSYT